MARPTTNKRNTPTMISFFIIISNANRDSGKGRKQNYPIVSTKFLIPICRKSGFTKEFPITGHFDNSVFFLIWQFLQPVYLKFPDNLPADCPKSLVKYRNKFACLSRRHGCSRGSVLLFRSTCL